MLVALVWFGRFSGLQFISIQFVCHFELCRLCGPLTEVIGTFYGNVAGTLA